MDHSCYSSNLWLIVYNDIKSFTLFCFMILSFDRSSPFLLINTYPDLSSLKKCFLSSFEKKFVFYACFMGFPVVQMVKNLLAMLEMKVRSLGREDPLEKGMATHSSILAWRIQWTQEPGRLHTVHGITKLDMTEWLIHLLSVHVGVLPMWFYLLWKCSPISASF